MSNNQNYTPAYLIACADLHHLDFIASSFTKSAELLLQNSNSSEHSQSFHLLVSVAFELFPKVMIACDVCMLNENNINMTEGQIRELVNKEMRKAGHGLDKLLMRYPGLLEKMKIEEINKIPDNNSNSEERFVSEYQIKLRDNPYIISIKDVEAVRYGSFSSNRDIMLDCTQDEKLLNLLIALRDYSREYVQSQINNMRSVI